MIVTSKPKRTSFCKRHIKKYLLTLVVFLLLVPLVYSEVQTLPTQQLNSCVNIPQTCSNCTYVNITQVTYPNMTTTIIGELMTSSGYNYNYSFCNTTLLGDYIVTTCGDVDGVLSCVNYDFLVTSTGTILETSQAIIYFVFLICAIGAFIICLYYAVKIRWSHERDEEGFIVNVNDLRFVKIVMIVFCYLILMFIFGLMTGITSNFIPEIGVSGFFKWGFNILLALMYPLIVSSLVFALMIFLSNKKLQNALEKGIPVE
jgi:hypothetical protein